MTTKQQKEKEQSRETNLKVVINQIEKRFGHGAIMKLGEIKDIENIGVISTGALTLDLALGIGGVPKGRVTEIYGPESAGKTTLALNIIAEAQKKGGIAAFIDVEHALDPIYASTLGVDIDNLLISQPNSGEEALEITDMLVRSGGCEVIVIDSVAALVPRAELEGDMGDSHMGLQARLMSQALRKLTATVSKSRTAIVFLNQVRSKIGIVFGNPEVTPGGRALKFYSSVRIELARKETLIDKGNNVGIRVKAKIVKNKVAPPFRKAEFDIEFGRGISRAGCILDLALEKQIVNRSGAWYVYHDQQLGQGRDNAKKFLEENPEVYARIEQAVKDAVKNAEK